MGKCDFEGCDRTEVLPFKCKFCHKSFCRIHRLPENHNCEKLHLSVSPLSSKPKIVDAEYEIVEEASLSEEEQTHFEEAPKKSWKEKRIERRQRRAEERLMRNSRKVYHKKRPLSWENSDFIYAADNTGNVFTAKPEERIFKDRMFFSAIGDHFTVGHEVFDFLLGLLAISVPWGLMAKLIYHFDRWYYVPVLIALAAIIYSIHILPQKWIGNRFGVRSRYVLSKIGLIITLISHVSPIRFYTPGALVIPEIYYIHRKHRGLISIVGVLINLALGITFLFLGIFLKVSINDISLLFLSSSYLISQILIVAILPFRLTLGRRIFDWRPAVYYVLLTLILGLMIGTFLELILVF